MRSLTTALGTLRTRESSSPPTARAEPNKVFHVPSGSRARNNADDVAHRRSARSTLPTRRSSLVETVRPHGYPQLWMTRFVAFCTTADRSPAGPGKLLGSHSECRASGVREPYHRHLRAARAGHGPGGRRPVHAGLP